MGYHMTFLLTIEGETTQAVVVRVPQGDLRVLGEVHKKGEGYQWKYWPYKRKPVQGAASTLKLAMSAILDSNTIYTYRAVVGNNAGPQVSARSIEEARQLLDRKLKKTKHIFRKQWASNGKDVQIWYKYPGKWQ